MFYLDIISVVLSANNCFSFLFQTEKMGIGHNCSLHISQRLSELYPMKRAVPVISKSSAVGMVMATGTVDVSMRGHLGVFLSTDGAVSWKQVLKGNYLYSFGDHGGIIMAVNYYKPGLQTNELYYSTDEGETWKTFQFYNDKIKVLGKFLFMVVCIRQELTHEAIEANRFIFI